MRKLLLLMRLRSTLGCSSRQRLLWRRQLPQQVRSRIAGMSLASNYDEILQLADDVFAALKAPHTLAAVTADDWDRPYSRQQAAFPMEGQQESKVWPAVARIDNAFGDRNLVCTCPSVEAVAVAA